MVIDKNSIDENRKYTIRKHILLFQYERHRETV